MNGGLDGRAVIVTGGATGIGLGITRRLLGDGARVLVSALTKEQLDIPELDGVPGFAGDLSVGGVADDLLAAAVAEFGVVDVLVDNAGGGVIRPTLEHDEQSLQATITNNLWTTIRATLAVLPHMVAHGGGRVINIGAESVRNGLTDHAVYNAAKGGVHAFAVGLAREFAPAGITVNTIAPSYVKTPELAALIGAGRVPDRLQVVLDHAERLIPLGRPGSVEDVAPGRGVHHRPDDQRQRRKQHGIGVDVTTSTDVRHEKAAERLRRARESGTPCAPIRDLLTEDTFLDPAAVRDGLGTVSATFGGTT